MSDKTKIEWTDATVNVINGCTVHSPGCTNCYAMRLAGTRLKHDPSRAGLTMDTKAGPVWTGEVRFNERALMQPLRWKRPRRIFWNAHGDMFHDNVPDEWIDRCFAVMALTPQHTHQVLTKRSERMRKYVSARPVNAIDSKMCALDPKGWGMRLDSESQWPLHNVWLGVSVEDQARADQRIPDLLATPAAVRWASAEPLLGPVDLNRIHEVFDGGLLQTWESALDGKRFDPWTDFECDPMLPGYPKLDWVVAGGESGPNARPMHPDWARSLRDQCAAAGVAFNFKQWGEWSPYDRGQVNSQQLASPGALDTPLQRVGKKMAGRLLDGVQHDGYPA